MQVPEGVPEGWGGWCCAQERPPKTGRIVYRTLGRTGLRLPVVSMGTAYAINLVHAALEAGIVHIHTSSSYSERNHERMLGRLFQDRPRDSFVIATSPDLPWPYLDGQDRSSDLGRDTDPALISESLESSLQRLRLDFVDIFYLVSIDSGETALHEPYMRAFDKLKEQGKTRFTGIGTHSNEPEVIRAAAESGLWDVVLTAYNFRQSHRREIRAAIDQAAEAGLGVVAMKTQAGVYWDRRRRRMINMKAALKWVLQNENVHTTIPAFSNYDEMSEDLSIMENLSLTPEEERDLRLGDELGFSGVYCQQCGQCLAQCPVGMDIPTLMRASMYAFGHQQPQKARDTLRTWKPSAIACETCQKCAVHCSLGLDVKSSALATKHLLQT
jgi:predicted aldo/keto reductase-like oxidoreductase